IAAEQPVIAAIAVQVVFAVLAEDDVVAAAAMGIVCAVAGDDDFGVVAAGDMILAVAGDDDAVGIVTRGDVLVRSAVGAEEDVVILVEQSGRVLLVHQAGAHQSADDRRGVHLREQRVVLAVLVARVIGQDLARQVVEIP